MKWGKNIKKKTKVINEWERKRGREREDKGKEITFAIYYITFANQKKKKTCMKIVKLYLNKFVRNYIL